MNSPVVLPFYTLRPASSLPCFYWTAKDVGREKARRKRRAFGCIANAIYARGLAPRKIRPVVAMGWKPSIIVG